MAINESKQIISLIGNEVVGDRQFSPAITAAFTFLDGTGASKGTKVGKALVTLSSGAAQQIALTSSTTFEDAAGDAITFTKIKGIAFSTRSGSATSDIGATANSAAMVIGANGSNDWDTLLNATGTLTVPAESLIVALTGDADGWAVTASDIINVDGDGSDKVLIWVFGEAS